MGGRFRQFLPLILISQHAEFIKLNAPLADHYVLSVSQMLTENTRLTVEGYLKEYRRLPLDPAQPSLFVIDESNDQNGYLNHERLVASGKAFARGVELMVQKKLMEKLYGIISGSLFRARYQGFDGVWRDRIYNNRFIMTIEAGYKANSKWEFGMRWVFAGGAPYTPFDEAASSAARTGIYDERRVNSERLPDYHTLNLRVDRRFNFRKTNLIVYLSVANVYGRENVASYFWSEVENKKRTMNQWGMLPIFGVEFEY
jgi:hypothetical protein